MMLCRCRKIVRSGVTLLFLLFVQRKVLFQGFWDLLCSFTGAESTENIIVTFKLLQILLHVLHRGFSIVPVMCHKVKIHSVLDAQQGFCEGNPLAHQKVWKSQHENWNNHAHECFHLLTTTLRHLATWLVKLSQARIWRHHCQELVEFVNPGMLFKKGHFLVYQMLMHTEIEGMKNFGYDNSHPGDAFHIPEDAFWGSNCSILQILSCSHLSISSPWVASIIFRKYSW